MRKSPHNDYYTVAEAAEVLDVSPSTVWRWIDAEILPAYRVGPRSLRIKKQDLDSIVRPASAPAMPDKERIRSEPPTLDELARRRVLAEKILSLREQFSIAPLTTARLVHEVRREEERGVWRKSLKLSL